MSSFQLYNRHIDNINIITIIIPNIVFYTHNVNNTNRAVENLLLSRAKQKKYWYFFSNLEKFLSIVICKRICTNFKYFQKYFNVDMDELKDEG